MACSHWFDGFTTVHKFEINPGQADCLEVWYSSYCQVDELIESARRTGRLNGITFGQKRDPCDTLYRKVKSVFTPILPGSPHDMNIGVTIRDILPAETLQAQQQQNHVPGRHLMSVTTDSHASKQFDAETLEPVGVTRQDGMHPALTGPISGAHAAHDPQTGELFNYNLAFGAKATYRVFRASTKTGKVDILAEISGQDIRGAYIHSMSITKNFVILCVWPAFFSSMGISILWNRNLMDAIAPFDANSKTTWLVIDRHHGRGLVKTFTSPAFFSFHTVNAWEEQQDGNEETVDIVCELVEFKNTDILHRFYYDNLVSEGHGVESFCKTRGANTAASLTRYKLAGVPLTAKESKPSKSTKVAIAKRIMCIASPRAGDLPRVNPRYAQKPHRFVWSLVDRGKSSFIDGIVKTDTKTETALIWELARHTPGEPIFVPAPDGKDEDEGVLLSVVLDGTVGLSYLLCLDARTMREIGRAGVGKPVGIGFHGLHVPASASRADAVESLPQSE